MWKLLSMDVRNEDSFLPKKGGHKDAHDMVSTLFGGIEEALFVLCNWQIVHEFMFFNIFHTIFLSYISANS